MDKEDRWYDPSLPVVQLRGTLDEQFKQLVDMLEEAAGRHAGAEVITDMVLPIAEPNHLNTQIDV